MEEENILSNLCGDLVSLTRLEPALVHLFGDRASGTWVPVRELYARAGYPNESIKANLAATWLQAPSGDPDAAVVLFYDYETLWSMTAWYNLARLLERHPVAAAG